jgi:hypothetical protein
MEADERLMRAMLRYFGFWVSAALIAEDAGVPLDEALGRLERLQTEPCVLELAFARAGRHPSGLAWYPSGASWYGFAPLGPWYRGA